VPQVRGRPEHGAHSFQRGARARGVARVEQLVERDPAQRVLAQGVCAQAERVDVGDERRSACEQLVGARTRGGLERGLLAAAAFAEQRGDPLGEARPRVHTPAQRAEFQVRVRVDESRRDEHRAQVQELDGRAAPECAQLRRRAQHACDPPALDPQAAPAQGQPLRGEDPAALQQQAWAARGSLG